MSVKMPTKEELAELLVGMEDILSQRVISSAPASAAPAPEPQPEPAPPPTPKLDGAAANAPAPAPEPDVEPEAQETPKKGKSVPDSAKPRGKGMAFLHSPRGRELKEGLSSLIGKVLGGRLKAGSPPAETLSKAVGDGGADFDALAREAADSGAGVVFLITAGMEPAAAKSLQEALSRQGLAVERVDGNSLPGKAALLDILLDLKALGF